MVTRGARAAAAEPLFGLGVRRTWGRFGGLGTPERGGCFEFGVPSSGFAAAGGVGGSGFRVPSSGFGAAFAAGLSRQFCVDLLCWGVGESALWGIPFERNSGAAGPAGWGAGEAAESVAEPVPARESTTRFP